MLTNFLVMREAIRAVAKSIYDKAMIARGNIISVKPNVIAKGLKVDKQVDVYVVFNELYRRGLVGKVALPLKHPRHVSFIVMRGSPLFPKPLPEGYSPEYVAGVIASILA